MENKALKTDVYTNENIWVDSCEQPIDVDFNLPDYCPDISKIFKCKAVSRISSKSLNDKSITIDGNICITVLYCDKDNNLCSYEYQYPFNKVKEIEQDTQGCNVSCFIKTDYINCRAVTSRKIDIHGAATINIKLFCRKRCNVISDIDDPSIEIRRATAPSTSPMGYSEKYVIIEEEIACSNGSAAINRILRYDAYPSVTDCKVINDKIMVKGDMAVTITYCAENLPSPQIMKTILPFSQVVDMQGVTDDCQCETKTTLAFLDIKPKANMSGECKIFALSAKLLICSQAYCQNDVPIINDAFSRRFEADFKKDKIVFTKMCENIKEHFHFKQNVVLSESIASVLDLWCDIQSQSVKFTDDKMQICGTLIVGIVSISESGETCYIEKPLDFEYNYAIQDAHNNLECLPEISIISCGYTINSPTNLEIRADMAVNAAVIEKRGIELLTDITLNEGKLKPKNNSCSMTIYFVSGEESIWNIARIYNASVDEIIKINNLDDEYVKDGTMLLVPVS